MRRKSRSCCDFRYFLPKYFRYRLEKGASTVTWTFDFSLLMLTLSPKFPVLPSTLMRPSRNFSKSLVSMMLSEDGCSQSMVYLSVLFLPLSAPAFVFKPLATILLAVRFGRKAAASKWLHLKSHHAAGFGNITPCHIFRLLSSSLALSAHCYFKTLKH